MTPGGALRRSLVVWGWGQAAAGDRRAWLLAPIQALVVAVLVVVGPSLAGGTLVGVAFLLGVGLLVAWIAVALAAYRRAGRRRARIDLPAEDGGAIVLLWIAPLAIVVASLFWGLAGRGADPATVLDRYVADWRDGHPADAGALFVSPPGDDDQIADAWTRQSTALRNALVPLAAQAPDDAGIDPDEAFTSIRWVDRGPTADGGRRIAIEVARRDTVRGTLFGILPTTSQRLVTLAEVGAAELRQVAVPGAVLGTSTWRIVGVAVAGIVVGDGAVVR